MSKERLFVCGFNGFGQLTCLIQAIEEDSSSHCHSQEFESVEKPMEFCPTALTDFLKLELSWSSVIILKEKRKPNNFIQVCGGQRTGSQMEDNMQVFSVSFDDDNQPTMAVLHLKLVNTQMKCGFNFVEYEVLKPVDNSIHDATLVNVFVQDCYFSGNKLCILSQDESHIQKVYDSELHKKGPLDVNEHHVCRVGFGDSHFIFMLETGDLFSIQQLNQGMQHKITKLQISPSFRVKSICCGKEHCLLLTDSGLVLSFGYGTRGQLGHGSTDKEEYPCLVECLEPLKIVSVAAGGWHSLALAESGDIYAWGWNESGQLGIGNPRIEISVTEKPDENKNFVPMCQMFPRLIELDSDVEFISISCGSRHSAAVSKNRELWTWGWNQYGQLGHGDKQTRYLPTLVEHFVGNQTRVNRVQCRAWNTVAYCM